MRRYLKAMVVEPQLVGTFQAVLGVLSLLFLKPALANREKPESRYFLGFLAGVILFKLSLAAGNFTSDPLVSRTVHNTMLFGVQVLSLFWFLLALEITGRREITRSLVGALASGIVLLQVLIWTNSVHELVRGPGTTMDGIVLLPEHGLGFWVHTMYGYTLILFAVIIFALETHNSSGIRRKQMLVLTIAVLPSVLANAASLSGVFGIYDLTPVGYVLTVLLFAFALFSTRFLDITTVARRTAMEEMHDAVVTVDEQNRVVDCNSRAREFLSMDDEYVGTPATDCFDPIFDDSQSVLGDESTTDREVSATLAGEQRYFSVTTTPVRSGADEGQVVVLHDITEQKRRQRELHERQEELRHQRQQIARLHDVGVELAQCESEDRVYDIMVEAGEEILGLDHCLADSVQDGRFVIESTSSSLADDEYAEPRVDSPESGLAGKAYRSGASILDEEDELPEANPEGEFPSSLTVPIGEYGIFQALSQETIAFDQTDVELVELLAGHVREALRRIEHEHELKRKNERLERFAGVVSHDLRNPLNTAQMRAQMAEQTGEREHFDALQESHDRMETMISDMLTLARTETTVEETEETNLSQIVTDAWETARTDGAALDTDLGWRDTVEADPDLLQHVLENLFRNAVDHNDTPVTVRVGTLSETDDAGPGFYVEDDGVGIPASQREQILEHGFTTSDDGTGLGLAIVDEFVTVHGWNLTVTEGRDGGARFEISTD